MSSTNDPTTPPTPAADDHGGFSGPPPQETIARGYERDTYDARTVLSVPVLVVLFFLLAFGTVTALFAVLAYPKADPKANQLAVERNGAPLNDRLSRNYRGPKDGSGQPRLEPLKLRDDRINLRAITRPELKVKDGNSPELHPEDIRVTPEKFPSLYATGDTKLGLDKTMALDDKALADLFKVQATAFAPTGSRHAPTAANAGQGAADSVAVKPGPAQTPAPAPPAHKGDH
jgi:hypothetical protein